MKNIILWLIILGLVGCSTTVPLVPTFPEPPSVLLKSCGPLDTIDKENVLLSEFLLVVRSNYEKYHNCHDLVSEWQAWYKEQKSLYESLR